MQQMKISFIAENDWANILTEWSHCLNEHSEDIEAKSICLRPHSFNYTIPHDCDLEKSNESQKLEAKQFLEESDVIIFGEEGAIPPTNFKILEIIKQTLGVDLINSNKKLCIWHPGTHYRQNYNFYNNHPLRNKIHKHLYGIDLYRLSNKEENDLPIHAYQYINFSYEKFISDFKSKLKIKPWTILHIPREASIKGTEQINKVISKLDLNPNKFQYKTLTGIPYSKVIEEKKKSIFYIDQFSPVNVGGYGVSTLESLFNSNLTFSTIDNISDSMFKLTGQYECPVISLGVNQEELYSTLNDFILTPTEDQLIEYMKGIGQWLETVYSPKSIINYFKNI